MDAIEEFLDTWWGDTMDWYLEKFRNFQWLFQAKKDLQDEYGYHSVRMNQTLNSDYVKASEKLESFMSRLGESQRGLVQMMFYHDNQHQINPSKVSAYNFLAGIITNERKRKLASLIAKIEKKAGKIVDARALSVGVDGNLNGVVIGDKASVRINTIYAGGYNIQCFHFRVLVKEIK